MTFLSAAEAVKTSEAAEASESRTELELKSLDYLSRELEANADLLIRTGEDVDDFYSELNWDSVADSFPARFDLREQGTVTPVRNQTPWSTCWSFADIAASETSILNSLEMTAEQYKTVYGEDLDLSERQLAWFTAAPLPELDEYAEGEYPDPKQAGEDMTFTVGLTVPGAYCPGDLSVFAYIR